jgi:hypothetical protein
VGDIRVRRILVLVVLVVILAALFTLSRSVAGWQHYLVSGSANTVLYAASFDGGGADGFNGDWSQYAGRLSAALEGGQMRVTVGEAGGGAYSVAAPYFSDFDVRVAARAVSGPVDNAYGLVFRLQSQDNRVVEDDSYYLFLVSSDGYYRVTRAIRGNERVISDWIESPLVAQGLDAVNRLRVTAAGDQFRFFINDQPVTVCIPDDPDAQSTINPLDGSCMGGKMLDTLTDASIPYGQIGVGALWTSESATEPVVAAFDNLLVYGTK